jgi:hypothetical protein
VFSFTDNSIEGTIPSEFAKLSGMQYLDLGWKQVLRKFSTTHPESF